MLQMNMLNLLVNLRQIEGLVTTLAECGSSELVLALYKKERAAFYNKYGLSPGENKNLRRIFYVRYADDFIVSINGLQNFATEIETFIKSDPSYTGSR